MLSTIHRFDKVRTLVNYFYTVSSMESNIACTALVIYILAIIPTLIKIWFTTHSSEQPFQTTQCHSFNTNAILYTILYSFDWTISISLSLMIRSWLALSVVGSQMGVYVLRRVGMGTIPALSRRKVGILTLPGEVGSPTWHGSIPELSLRKVGIGTKWESIIFLRKVGIGDKVRLYVS